MTNYPGSLDEFNTISPSDPMDGPGRNHDEVHNNVQDAIVAIEEKVGTAGSLDTDSLEFKTRVHAGLDKLGTAVLWRGDLYLKYQDGWRKIIPLMDQGDPSFRIDPTVSELI